MNDKLKQNLVESLSKEKRYLLGLSGGSDSLGLFYALIEYGFDFEVCTIDHQSRDEITIEVAFIRKICQENGISFHIEQIEAISIGEANLEDRYRQARLSLFEKVYSQGQFNGLILGHHADDQVETILKRFLEGASVSALKGIAPVNKIGSMQVIRPFLSLKKEEVVSFLKERNKSWFEDSTNKDCRYLRARMRKKILPNLQRDFGKEFKENILQFSRRMRQIEEFFQERVQSDQGIQDPIDGPFGKFYPIETEIKEIEAEFILREILKRESWTASREEIKRLSGAMVKKENGIEICRKDRRIISDRHGLFFPREGSITYTLTKKEDGDEDVVPGWRGVLRGRVMLPIDCQNVVIKESGKLTNKLPSGISLKKWYVKHKVPPHLRSCIPVIWRDGCVVGECLSGHPAALEEEKWVLTFNVKKNTIDLNS